MRWTSALAIYILFWTMSLFLVLPFGVRTPEEAGAEAEPGTHELQGYRREHCLISAVRNGEASCSWIPGSPHGAPE